MRCGIGTYDAITKGDQFGPDRDPAVAEQGVAESHVYGFPGPRPYEYLSNYLRRVDACILPFRRTPELNGYLPGQVYEMLCGGRPVVASPLRELAQRNLAGVHVASSGADFTRACHRAVAPMTEGARREIIRQVVGRPGDGWPRSETF